MRRKFKIPLVMLGIWLLIVLAVQVGTGIPVFKELRERTERIAERLLPVKTVDERASEALGARLASAGLKLGSDVFVRIFKEEAELEIWMRDGDRFRLLYTYPICKFSGFLGPKLKEGDRQSPEGFYAVTTKQLNPGSRHYRAFNIGFPNAYDRAHGRTGSALMVHGGCSSIGCYAMTDIGVAEIYALVETALQMGQQRVPVHIFPFRMTEERVSQQPLGPWSGFWDNIKHGHDLFEKTGIPPRAGVCGKRYVFGKDAGNCQLIAGW